MSRLDAAERGRRRLSTQLVLLAMLTALISVLATGAVSVGLIRSAALTQAQAALAEQADVTAELVSRLGATGSDDLAVVAAVLGRQQIEAFLVLGGGQPDGPPAIPAELLEQARLTGQAADVVGPPRSLVQARSVGPGAVLVLVQPVSAAVDDLAGPVVSRLLLALLAGLVTAALAGLVLARWLARPLQRTAEAARGLTRGERAARVEPAGPQEVAEVAEALNGLTDALVASEGRQRRFLLSISHELRTPLTAIRGYGEALADGVLAGGEARRAGEVVIEEADRLERLVSDLLELARAEADDFGVHLEVADVAAVAAEAFQAWVERFRRSGVLLRADLGDGPATARLDKTRLRQVLDALLANALRVVPAGKPVVIAAGRSGQPGSSWVQIRDGGPGLSDDDLAVAFEQGVLHDRYAGPRAGSSGLGLALARRLVERMGGQITVEHAAEGGVAFTAGFAALTPPSMAGTVDG